MALIAVCLLLVAPQVVFAQGFQVKPMMMQFGVPAGRIATTTLDLTNTSAEPLILRLYAVDLTQAPTGSWQMIAPDSGSDVSHLSSALEWTNIDQESIDIAPATTGEVHLRFSVPASARGTYVAGIVAEQPTPEGAEGLVVRVRFLIPVIIQIDGRPVRQNVTLPDVGMQRVDAVGDTSATTNLTMTVANEGRTYSRVRGQIVLQAGRDGKWQTVTRADVAERGIIPGVTLSLQADIKRRLPSGEYRLHAELFVDGRRVAPIDRDVLFDGDPTVDQLAFDTTLLLEPSIVNLKVAPGATRTAVLTVENPSDEPVTVSMSSGTPKSLSGVVMGELVGTSLSAEPWTEIRPSEFVLRPGRRQNVRVISRIPSEQAQYPNYYADLVLRGTYENGQSAGETRSMVHLTNGELDSHPNAIVEQFALSESDKPGQFSAQVRLVNTGNVDIEPAPTLSVLTPRGDPLQNSSLTGEPGILLPLGIRTYGGELDFNNVEPGTYILRATFPIAADKNVTDQHVLVIEAGKRTEADGEVVNAPIVTLDPEGTGVSIESERLAPTDAAPPVENARGG